MEKLKFRPAAVPLVTVDPFFSIWSFGDNLYDDTTYHWTGKRNPMTAFLNIDGTDYMLMGCHDVTCYRQSQKYTPYIPQISCKISPTRTVYEFANETVSVNLEFTSPLLLNRLDIMSRPVSYIEYNVKVIDGSEHNIFFYFDISSECALDGYDSEVVFKKCKNSVAFGNANQNVLSKSGDSVTVDWGYIHLAHPKASVYSGIGRSFKELNCFEENAKFKPFVDYYNVGIKTESLSGVLTLAYDDIKAIEYFGKQTDGYYKKFYPDFETMLEEAISDYDEVKSLCIDFDKRLIDRAGKIGDKYEKIVSLAYRQAIAAHKLIEDENGEIVFLSKECHSNGCIGTLDVTYPSIPLFLIYNPELVLGMLRPIIKYANSSEWKFDFAPHDVGQYPLANGQVYGDNKLEMQMPVEECGNMLLCVAAASKAMKSREFAAKNKEILKLWADYLVKVGYNPENQLCTDDFAGHLAHNCNLGIKSILGIAAYGKLFEEEKYMDIAKKYAKEWEKEAKNSIGTKLAFDKEDSWSLKYNIVWDKLLGLNVFSENIFENEIKLYSQKINKYGVPLDSRENYTKIDWLMWTTVMTDNEKYRDMVVDAIFDFINETTDRTPMTDWYFTSFPRMHHFQNRTVVGGLFINML